MWAYTGLADIEVRLTLGIFTLRRRHHMLTTEIVLTPEGAVSDEVEIYFDKEGLEYLIYRLSHILEGKTNHIHLMSESWGTGELNEISHKPNNNTVHHLRMTLMDD